MSFCLDRQYVDDMLNPSEIFQFKTIETKSESKGNSTIETIYCTEWSLGADCPYLNGHFPNQPLLPAVATIDGSIELLRLVLQNPRLNPHSIFNAKFMAPITPGLKMELRLFQVVASKWQVDWYTQNASDDKQLLARVGLQI